MKRLFVVVVLLAVIAGCGGGGGGGTEPIPTSNVTRQLQPGDSLTYSVTGNIDGEPVTGTIVCSTSKGDWTPTYGTRALKLTQDLALKTESVGNISVVATSYYEQDAAGVLYYVGMISTEGESWFTESTAAPVVCPSPIAVGYSTSYTATTTKGTSQYALSVMALESVGGRKAYRIHITTIGPDGTSAEDDWYVPDMGYPVKFVVDMQEETRNMQFTATLKSFNLK